MNQRLNIPSDYPLPNLYYFPPDLLIEIRKQLTNLVSILNQAGFEECHLPFLVPRSILLNYKGIIPLKSFIKAYPGKDRRSYVYLRPDGIFSQGIVLAKKMINSYRDLPLKLFEISSGYTKGKNVEEKDVFSSPEQSFSIQGGVFTEHEGGDKHLQTLLIDILHEFSIAYSTKNVCFSKAESIQYTTKFRGDEITIARLYIFNQEVPRRAHIYFFNSKGVMVFPYMYTFSLSQNIPLIKILREGF